MSFRVFFFGWEGLSTAGGKGREGQKERKEWPPFAGEKREGGIGEQKGVENCIEICYMPSEKKIMTPPPISPST